MKYETNVVHPVASNIDTLIEKDRLKWLVWHSVLIHDLLYIPCWYKTVLKWKPNTISWCNHYHYEYLFYVQKWPVGTRIVLCSLEWKGHDQTLNLDLLVLGITTNAKKRVTAKFRLLPAQYSAHYHLDAIMVIPNSFLSKIVNTNWLLFEWLWI